MQDMEEDEKVLKERELKLDQIRGHSFKEMSYEYPLNPTIKPSQRQWSKLLLEVFQ